VQFRQIDWRLPVLRSDDDQGLVVNTRRFQSLNKLPERVVGLLQPVAQHGGGSSQSVGVSALLSGEGCIGFAAAVNVIVEKLLSHADRLKVHPKNPGNADGFLPVLRK